MTSRAPITFLLSLLLAASGLAQCAPVLLPEGGVPGVGGEVYATTAWDPDGAGPLPALLIVGGTFNFVDGIAVNNIAAWDPTTQAWLLLGSGVTGLFPAVRALALAPNGDLLAAGSFDTAGGAPAANIARWNGTSWSSVGSGIPISATWGSVLALAMLPNGDIVAGGSFSTSSSSPGDYLLRGNGVSWTQFGSPSADVRALTSMPNGDLVVGGQFTSMGAVPGTRCVALWNGTAWSGLDTGFGGGLAPAITSLLALPNGDLIAGGQMTQVGSGNLAVAGVARWDGTLWSAMAGGISGGSGSGYGYVVYSLSQTQNGDVIAGGEFQFAGGAPINGVARWNGSAWSQLGPGLDRSIIYATTVLPGGDIVAGNAPALRSGLLTAGIARFDGSAWLPMSQQPGFLGAVHDIAPLPNGDALVAGRFAGVGGVALPNIARWNGATYSPIGGSFGSEIHAVLPLPNGDVMVAGDFRTFLGAPGDYVARWDGTTWYPVGTPGNSANGTVYKLVRMQNGDVIATGTFPMFGASYIARWNGAAWLSLGSGTNGSVYMMQPLQNGHVAVGGSFTTAGGLFATGFAIWDGTSWYVPPGSNMNNAVLGGAVLQNGDLVVSGFFTSVGAVAATRIARWNGTIWSPLGSGLNDVASDLLVLPNGELLAGGTFTASGSVPLNRLARWHGGVVWSAFGPGVDDGWVRTLAMLPDGTVAVGGTFSSVGGVASNGYVRLPSSCPASSVSTSTACTGPVGAINARATSLPWLGSVCGTTASGFAQNSVGLLMSGFGTQQLPLSQVHPAGLSGCDVLVTLDATRLLLPVAGQATFDLPIPNALGLLGVVLHHQYLQADFAVQGALLSLSSSNALTLTVGAY